MNTWRTASFQPQKLLASWRRWGLDWSNHLEPVGPLESEPLLPMLKVSTILWASVVLWPPSLPDTGILVFFLSFVLTYFLSPAGGSGPSAQIHVCFSKCVLNASVSLRYQLKPSFKGRFLAPSLLKSNALMLNWTLLPVWYIYIYLSPISSSKPKSH